jgi:transposase-like protein
MSVLNAPHFHDEEAAYEFVEARVWPHGRVCPKCGTVDQSGKLQGKSTRIGTYKCYACRKPFTVKVGTIFESSHVKLHIWLQAIFLIASSKKGISANQLHRTLGVTLKTAWFMGHRIREAMRDGKFAGPLGGPDMIVEADETLIGGKERNKHVSKRNPKNIGSMGKECAFSLVERGGRVRSFHVASVSAKNLRPILHEQLDRASTLMSDDAGQYRILGPDFARHESVNHSIDEYVRGDARTNTIEGYFSLLKRGINGTYHHVSPAHLKRYLAEFDFRYNERVALGVDDQQRADKLLKGIVGKRLTYQTTDNQTA